MNTLKILALCFLVTVTGGSALADTASLPASKDNTIHENPDGAFSNGKGVFFFVGKTLENVNTLRRGAMAFDLTSIPPNSTVTAASLSLSVSKVGPAPAPGNISLY